MPGANTNHAKNHRRRSVRVGMLQEHQEGLRFKDYNRRSGMPSFRRYPGKFVLKGCRLRIMNLFQHTDVATDARMVVRHFDEP